MASMNIVHREQLLNQLNWVTDANASLKKVGFSKQEVVVNI
jgi:hypothetical protein